MAIKTLLAFSLLILGVNLNAQIIEGYNFDDYETPKVKSNTKASLNFKSNPNAKAYKTRIKEGYNDGSINFASYFITIIWGCGSNCLMGVMVDVRDGKIYDLPIGIDKCSDRCYTTSSEEDDRITYKAENSLFVTTTCKEEPEVEYSKNMIQTKTFYINEWNDQKKKFVLLKKPIKKTNIRQKD